MPVIKANFLVYECDYPGCRKRITVKDICIGNYMPDEKALKAHGWTFSSFPNNFIVFCPACKDKELPTDIDRKKHDCIYVLTNKKGEPSERGKIARCVLCDQIKDD